jgi:phosphoglycolate phosphatase
MADGVVFFDLDGCVVDSRQPILRSLNVALAGMGMPTIIGDDLTAVVGPPLQEGVAGILERNGDDAGQAGALIAAYRADYTTTSVALATSYPGVPEALAALGATHTLGVVTSKPVHFARPILDALDLTDRFAVIEGPTLTESEPKTATLGRALERLGLAGKRRHVMIGDRRHDVAAAHAHGLTAIGVTWGFGSRDELVHAGADVIVERPARLVAAVGVLGP